MKGCFDVLIPQQVCGNWEPIPGLENISRSGVSVPWVKRFAYCAGFWKLTQKN